MRKLILIFVLSFFYSNFCIAETIEAQCDNRDYDYMNVKINFDKKILHINNKLKDLMFTKYKPNIVDIPIEFFDSERIEMKGDPGYTWSWYYGSDWRMVTHRETIPWVCRQSGVSQFAKKIELASMLDTAKTTCKELGFKEQTEKFSECALKLYSQSVELAAKNNQQVVMQGSNSGVMTIYDPVRDSNALIDKGMKMLSGRCTLGIDC